MALKQILEHPLVYQTFQEAGGFYGARLKAIRKYLNLRRDHRVIDIGCGPGFIARDMPAGVDYVGFDTDRRYIDYAKANFADRGRFYARVFDDATAEQFGRADVVMMNGALHHISDADARPTLGAIRRALRPGGVLFTLDGVYVEGQPWLAKWMLDNDRGAFVRTAGQYEMLLSEHFPVVDGHIHHDLAHVPCTLYVAVSRTPEPRPERIILDRLSAQAFVNHQPARQREFA